MKTITVKSKDGLLAAAIDDVYYEILKDFNWYLTHYGYVAHSVGREVFMLHHFILGNPKFGFDVDHINQDKLDNRKENLRYVSRSINAQNKPHRNPCGYRGVQMLRSGRWQAKIRNNELKKIECLGTFDLIEDAAKAYDKAALQIFGPSAQLNFPINQTI